MVSMCKVEEHKDLNSASRQENPLPSAPVQPAKISLDTLYQEASDAALNIASGEACLNPNSTGSLPAAQLPMMPSNSRPSRGGAFDEIRTSFDAAEPRQRTTTQWSSETMSPGRQAERQKPLPDLSQEPMQPDFGSAAMPPRLPAEVVSSSWTTTGVTSSFGASNCAFDDKEDTPSMEGGSFG